VFVHSSLELVLILSVFVTLIVSEEARKNTAMVIHDFQMIELSLISNHIMVNAKIVPKMMHTIQIV